MDSFWNWWNSLTPNARENILTGLVATIAGGIILSLVLAIFTGFWKLVGRAFIGALKLTQKLLNRLWPPDSTAKPALRTSTAEPALPSSLPAPFASPEKSFESQGINSQDTTPRETASLIPRPPVVGFVSRRDEQGHDIVERLKEELAPGRNRLVTLSGAGGLGKTTLAAEAARGLQAAYEGRVTWSSADGRPEFTLLSLLDDIATQLGQPGLRTLAPEAKAEQVRALVAAPPTLVTLDNCETISEEEHRRIESWFAQAQCSALFTSRQSVAGTVFVRVSAMSRDEAAEFLKRLAEQTHDPRLFAPGMIERVYEMAESNPYVMQWVVGQINNAQEPERVLQELAEGEGDAAERVFARSFNLPQLGDDGRDTLLALSLFVPNASREALAAVAGLGDDRKRLDEAVKHLHALWLVKGVDGNRRLAVEGLTRTLATARLSKDPRADEFRRRFIAHYLRYAAARQERTPQNYDALEEEKDNLLSAAEMIFISEDLKSFLWVTSILAGPKEGLLSVRGYWDEAIRLNKQSLQAARVLNDDKLLTGFARNLAGLHYLRGEYGEAYHLYGLAVEVAQRLGYQDAMALALWGLGNVFLSQKQFDEARKQYEKLLENFKVAKNRDGIAGVLHQLGRVAEEQGNYDQALRFYNESLEIRKGDKEQSNVAGTLNQLGNIAQAQGKTKEARRLYEESLEIKRRFGEQRGIAGTLNNLATLAEEEGHKEEAERLYREALSIWEKLGSPNAEIARRNLERVEGKDS